MPPAEVSPILLQVLMANLSSLSSLTTRPGHWSGMIGMVQYASATSQMAAWDPGGRLCTVKQMVAKVPQVQGNMSVSIEPLMEGSRGRGMGERKIVDGSVFTGLSWLWDPQKGGGLEGANECLDFSTRTGADVTTFPEFIRYHLLVGFRVLVQSGAIRGDISSVNGANSSIETVTQGMDKLGVFDR